MDICCSQAGNGTVNFYPDCYDWCNIEISGGDETQDDAFRDAIDGCKSCLTSGDNSTESVPRMVCSPGSAGTNGGSLNSPKSGSSGPVRLSLGVVLAAMLLQVGMTRWGSWSTRDACLAEWCQDFLTDGGQCILPLLIARCLERSIKLRTYQRTLIMEKTSFRSMQCLSFDHFRSPRTISLYGPALQSPVIYVDDRDADMPIISSVSNQFNSLDYLINQRIDSLQPINQF